MKVDYQGQVYDLDLENITLKQAMAIQGYCGMSIKKLFAQFSGLDEDADDTPEMFMALGALYWLMQNQAGNVFPIADADFPIEPFTEALFRGFLADQPAEPEPEAEPGPTVPSPASSLSPPALLSPSQSSQEVTPDLTVS